MVSANPLLSWSSKGCLDLKHADLLHLRWTLRAHKNTYPECRFKREGAPGLPPDDDRDPSHEQQQQHSHCCEHGVSREHLAGPLGQDQAQDGQQENCRGQGGGEQAGLEKPKMSGPRVTTPPPQAAHLRKGHRISKTPQLTKCTLLPPPVSLRI